MTNLLGDGVHKAARAKGLVDGGSGVHKADPQVVRKELLPAIPGPPRRQG